MLWDFSYTVSCPVQYAFSSIAEIVHCGIVASGYL